MTRSGASSIMICLVFSVSLPGCGPFVERHDVTQETAARLETEMGQGSPREGRMRHRSRTQRG
jgi:hypothetical protein